MKPLVSVRKISWEGRRRRLCNGKGINHIVSPKVRINNISPGEKKTRETGRSLFGCAVTRRMAGRTIDGWSRPVSLSIQSSLTGILVASIPSITTKPCAWNFGTQLTA